MGRGRICKSLYVNTGTPRPTVCFRRLATVRAPRPSPRGLGSAWLRPAPAGRFVPLAGLCGRGTRTGLVHWKASGSPRALGQVPPGAGDEL